MRVEALEHRRVLASYTLQVQIVQVCDDDGSNCAPLGPGDSTLETPNAYAYSSQVNEIFDQAGIDINFDYVRWNNSAGAELTSAELSRIFDGNWGNTGTAPPSPIDGVQFFFVRQHPGTSSWPQNPLGPGFGRNAGIAQLGIMNPVFATNGRGVMANGGATFQSISGTFAHEIGHTLGLRHIGDPTSGTPNDPSTTSIAAGTPNLMWAAGTGPTYDASQSLAANFPLTPAQINAMILNGTSTSFDPDGNGEGPLKPVTTATNETTISQTPVVMAEGDSGTTNFVFTVTRSVTSTAAATVSYAVTGSGDNPADDADFAGNGLPTGTVSFSGTAATATITIPVSGDEDFEMDEGFTVTLSGAEVGNASTATGTITNDDVSRQSVTIASTPVTMNEGNTGTTSFVFTVTRSDTSMAPATVTYEVVGTGTSSADANDFVGDALPTGAVTFSGSDATATISIPVSGDLANEPDETFAVLLMGNDVAASSSSATGTITNDDTPVVAVPMVTVSPAGPNGVGDNNDLGSGGQPTSWSGQRSTVRQITIGLPTAPSRAPVAADLLMMNRTTNAAITLADSQVSLDGTTLTVNFGADQLPDGVYDLTVKANLFGGSSDYTLTGDNTNKLFVKQADWNGDGEVNLLDFSTYRYWFGRTVDSEAPLAVDSAPAYVDLNGDGEINLLDFSSFRTNFGTSTTFPAATAPGSASSGPAGRSAEGEKTTPQAAPSPIVETPADAMLHSDNNVKVTLNDLAEAISAARVPSSANRPDSASAVDQLLSDDDYLSGLF